MYIVRGELVMPWLSKCMKKLKEDKSTTNIRGALQDIWIE